MQDSRNFPDRNGYALVTGGAVRIGSHIVRRLAASGWNVAIHAFRSISEGEELARVLRQGGTKAVVITGDLGDTATVDGLFAQAAALGTCSLLVNSASFFEYDDIASVTAGSLDRTYNIMLRAPLLLSHHFAEQLPAGARGLIVNLLDQKIFNLNRDFFSYTVMKCALEAATRLLALSLAPRIRVCAVAPGLSLPSGDQTDRGFHSAQAEALLGFGSTPDDIAQAVNFVVEASAMTGQTVVVDGGQSLVKRVRDVMFSHERAGNDDPSQGGD
jgi:hypothetical protein